MKLIKNQFISEGVQNCYFWVVANLNICSIQFVYCYRFNHFFSMFLFNITEIIRNFQNFVMISGSIERKGYVTVRGLPYSTFAAQGSHLELLSLFYTHVCFSAFSSPHVRYVRTSSFVTLLLGHLAPPFFQIFCSCQLPQEIG